MHRCLTNNTRNNAVVAVNKYYMPQITNDNNAHCVGSYLIPFEEYASDFLIFWSTHMSQLGKEKKRNPTMTIRDSLLTSAAEPGPSEQILAESAALASWLSPKAIVGFKFFFFPHF